MEELTINDVPDPTDCCPSTTMTTSNDDTKCPPPPPSGGVCDDTVMSSSSRSSSPLSSIVKSNTSKGGFVVVKKLDVSVDDIATATAAAAAAAAAAVTTVSDNLVEEKYVLGRNDAPNHILQSHQQQQPSSFSSTNNTNNSSFFQRLRTTRQALSSRANDVLTAATPALSIAGHVVKTAANHAAVVAASSYESFESTKRSSSDNNNNTSTTTNNPYDLDYNDTTPQSTLVEEDDLNEVPTNINNNNTLDKSDISTSNATTTSVSDVAASFRGRYAAPAIERIQKQERPSLTNSILHHAFGLPPKPMDNAPARRPPPPPLRTTTSNTDLLLPTSPFKYQAAHPEGSSSSTTGVRSQTALILQSSAGPHMHSLLSSLEPFEHVMLLGQGIMGVNLKDCYNGGVYVDMVVPNGNAAKSRVINVGDILVKVGDVHVRKLSIREVPHVIAKQPRPTVIVLSRKHLYPSIGHPVDDALATVLDIHQRIKEERERSIASMPFADTAAGFVGTRFNNNNSNNEDDTYNEEDSETASSIGYDSTVDDDDRSKGSTSVMFSSSDSNLTPRTSAKKQHSKMVQRSLAAYATRRNVEMSFYSTIKRAHQDDAFCHTMKNGLRAVCSDARCLPYFASHLTREATMYDSSSSSTTTTASPNSAKLMLLLETLAFHELWAVTPPQRRISHALRVASKFLLSDDDAAPPPPFDLRNDIPCDVMERVQQALAASKDEGEIVPRDIFAQVQSHLEQVFCGMHFSSFIMGESFAKMRAYISGSPTYKDVPLETTWQNLVVSGNSHAQNYMHYIMVHLASETNRGAGLAAALFIKRTILLQENKQLYQHLWNVYLSPIGGTLAAFQNSMSKDAADALANTRDLMVFVMDTTNDPDELVMNNALTQSLRILADELIYEYATNVYPRFKMDRLHDLLFREVLMNEQRHHQDDGSPILAKGCISRLVRSAKFPRSISTHRPHRVVVVSSSMEQHSAVPTADYSSPPPQVNCNAEFAVVFGTTTNTSSNTEAVIRRFYAVQVGAIVQPLKQDDSASLPPIVQSVEDLPATLEDYAALNPGRFIKRAMRNSQRACISDDGWEVYLSNFTMPHASADHPTNCLYGVSLVLHRSRGINEDTNDDTESVQEPAENNNCKSTSPMFQAIAVEGAERYLTFDIVHQVDQIFKEAPSPSRRHRKGPWSKQPFEGGHTVGISFIANSNVIPAMRQSLCNLFKQQSGTSTTRVAGLADLLGSFSCPAAETTTTIDLPTILRPHLESGSKEWIHRLLVDQTSVFEDQCVNHLLECLSPTAFGLAFLTVLLEQKVIFISSRRSTLLAAVTALSTLLSPLEWPHLTIPIVPANLAADLIQYPAPFLIGLCSQEKGNQEISTFPKDVTVVDLDLGRVLLGDKYASSDDSKGASSELRLQVISLAEEIGAYVGSIIAPNIWRCEDPHHVVSHTTKENKQPVCEMVRSTCREFVAELTAGVDSCCMWIEESDSDMKQESMVLFDEDRFFHLKDLRSKNMLSDCIKNDESSKTIIGKFAIGLDDSDLILETFLRGQAISAFISSRAKESMTYW